MCEASLIGLLARIESPVHEGVNYVELVRVACFGYSNQSLRAQPSASGAWDLLMLQKMAIRSSRTSLGADGLPWFSARDIYIGSSSPS